MTLINSQYKLQPVAAFYKLLGKNFLFLFCISLLVSFLTAFVAQFSLTSALGSSGLNELSTLMANPSKNMMEQSKTMQTFILKHPKLIPSMAEVVLLMLLFSAYIFYTTQRFIKNKFFDLNEKITTLLLPNKISLKILLYLILCGGYLLFTSGFIVVGITTNPVIGIIAALFIGLFLVRTLLVIPGSIMGDMTFIDALKYSFQIITVGRSFKILLFGTLLFFMLLFILSTILRLPLMWFNSNFAKLFINFLTLNLLIGAISIGMNALFLRYGNFEEENIAE